MGLSLGMGLGLPHNQAGVSGPPELLANGVFDADTDWVKGTGWTISGGYGHHHRQWFVRVFNKYRDTIKNLYLQQRRHVHRSFVRQGQPLSVL